MVVCSSDGAVTQRPRHLYLESKAFCLSAPQRPAMVQRLIQIAIAGVEECLGPPQADGSRAILILFSDGGGDTFYFIP